MDDITKKILLSFENLFSSEDKFKDFLIKSNSYYRYNYYNQGIIYHDNKDNGMVLESVSDTDIINRDKYITIYKNVENKYIPVKVYDIENFNNSFELFQKENFFKLNDQDKIATLRYINSNTKDIFSKASDKLDTVVTDKQLKKSIAEIIYTISLEKLEINSKIKLSNIGNILSLQNKAKQYILSVISNTRKNIILKTFKFIKDIKEEHIYEQGNYERRTNENNQYRGYGLKLNSSDGIRHNRGTQQQNVSGYISDGHAREDMHRYGRIDRQQDRRSISTSNKSIYDRGRKEQRVLFCKRRSSKQNDRYNNRGNFTLFYLSSVVPRRYRGRGYVFLKTIDYTTSNNFIKGKKSQCKNNILSIKIIKDMQKHDRTLTKQESDTLALYVGFGGISEVFNPRYKSFEKEYSELKNIVSDEEYNFIKRSTLTAFYTPKNIIEAMYKGVMNLGFDGGNILEPSMGIGNFFGSIPKEISVKTTLYGVEIEPVTGQIAKALYPSVNIEIKGYQDSNYPDNLFDLSISNIPFGDFKISDKGYNNSLYIHDYFLEKYLIN